MKLGEDAGGLDGLQGRLTDTERGKRLRWLPEIPIVRGVMERTYSNWVVVNPLHLARQDWITRRRAARIVSTKRKSDEAVEIMHTSIAAWNKAAKEILRGGDDFDIAELGDALEFARDLALHHQQEIESDRRRGEST